MARRAGPCAEAYLAKLIRAGFKVAVCEQLEDPAEARKRGSKAVVHRDVVRVVTPGTLTEDSLLDARGANRLAAVAVRDGPGGGGRGRAVDRRGRVPGAVSLEDLGARPWPRSARRRSWSPTACSPTRRSRRRSKARAASSSPAPGAGRARRRAEARVEAALRRRHAGRLRRLRGGRGLGAGPDRRLSGDHPGRQDARPVAAAPRRRDRLHGHRPGHPRRAWRSTAPSAASARARCWPASTAPSPRAARGLLAERLARPLLDPAAIDARLDAVDWLLERRDLRRDLREALQAPRPTSPAPSRAWRSAAAARATSAACATACRSARRVAGLFAPDPRSADRPAAPRSPPPSTALIPAPDLGRLLADSDRGPGRRAAASGPRRRLRRRRLRPELDAGPRACATTAAGSSPSSRPAPSPRAACRSRSATTPSSAISSRPAPRPPNRCCAPPANAPSSTARPWPIRSASPPSNCPNWTRRSAQAGRPRAGHRGRDLRGLARRRRSALAEPLQAVAEAAGRTGRPRRPRRMGRGGRRRPPRRRRHHLLSRSSAGRHPVVEAAVQGAGRALHAQQLPAGRRRAPAAPRLSIVTGPNMAGKSTFLRQNALLVVLAQAGAFVPARAMRLGVVDRLFSRVGAGDDLARGRSTFMTEMVETAAILTQATERSFVVLDEIGRGTATYDGLAIAWACAEALHETQPRPHPVRHPLSRAGRAGDAAGPRLQPVHGGQGVERRPGLPARGGARRRRPQLRRPGRQTGRRARRRRRPRPRGAGPAGGREERRRPASTTCPCSPSPNRAPPPRSSAVEDALGAIEPDELSPREALEALYSAQGSGPPVTTAPDDRLIEAASAPDVRKAVADVLRESFDAAARESRPPSRRRRRRRRGGPALFRRRRRAADHPVATSPPRPSIPPPIRPRPSGSA